MGPKKEVSAAVIALKEKYESVLGKAPKGPKSNNEEWLQAAIEAANNTTGSESPSAPSVATKREREDNEEKEDASVADVDKVEEPVAKKSKVEQAETEAETETATPVVNDAVMDEE